jgi:hypothetical protein
VSLSQVAERVSDLAQRIAPVDHRLDLAFGHELGQEREVIVPDLG